MKIEPHQHLIEVKRNFEHEFQGLSIEFFANNHHVGEGSPLKEKLSGKLTVAEIQPKFETKTLLISPKITVGELENMFLNETGLNVQVLRKMGNVWLETVQTDSYSLEKQMAISAEGSI